MTPPATAVADPPVVSAAPLTALVAMRDRLASITAGLEPARLNASEAGAVTGVLGEIDRLVDGARLLLAPRIAESGLWRAHGDRSPEEYLARQARCSLGEARSVVEAGRQLAHLPKAAAAARAGKLSLPQARAIAETATAVPGTEEVLLATAARDSLRALQQKGTHLRAAHTDSADRASKVRRERSLKTWTDADGAFRLEACGPADEGVRLLAALHPYQRARFEAGRTAATHQGSAAEAWDALIDLTTGRTLTGEHDPEPTANGTAAARVGDGSRQPVSAASTRRPPTGMKMILRIDHAALLRGYTFDGETCDVTGLGPIPAAAMRELLADAFLAAVVTRGEAVQTVTHLGRRPSATQLTALQWTQPGCTVLGCTQTLGIENDHREDFARTHHTRLDETDPLCGHHHDLKTNHGWHLASGIGRRPMLPPNEHGPPGPGP